MKDPVKEFLRSTFIYVAIMLDLPTITEVRRTLDDASFYKVCDLSQVLYVFEPL